MNKHIKRIVHSDILKITITYFLSNMFLLISIGVYWDDWTLFSHSKETIINTFNQTGYGFAGYFHTWMINHANPFMVYRVSTFFIYFISLFLIKKIFESLNFINKNDALLLTLLAAVLPVNFAKITFICFPYGLGYIFFLCGTYTFLIFHSNRFLLLRIISLVLFFVSFIVNSFLVFYIIVPFLILYKMSVFSLKKIFNEFLKYADFIILPVVFWVIKNILMSSSGTYEKYNKFRGLFALLQVFFMSIKEAVLDVFTVSFTFLINNSALILLFSIPIYFYFKKIISKEDNSKRSYVLFLLGWVLFFFAFIPYVLVGKVPQFYELWNDRHLLSAPFIFPFIILYGLKIFKKEFSIGHNLYVLIYTVIVITFICMNLAKYYQFQIDWIKQVAIINTMKESDIIRDNSTFIVKDNATSMNVDNRIYRFYELNGMARKAFGNSSRLLVPFHEKLSFFKDENAVKNFINNHEYNMADYKISKPEYVIEINKSENSVTIFNVIGLLVKRNPFPDKYKEFIELKVRKIDEI